MPGDVIRLADHMPPCEAESRRERIFRKIMARVKVHLPTILETGCWEWLGGDSGKTGRGAGYPRMKLDGGTVAVHICMWILIHGMIPPRKQIDHRCNMRMCVNPDHLQMVTHKRNQLLRDQRRAAA